MAIYEIATDGIRPLSTTTFEQAKLRERGDLQRLLRERIDVVAPDTMVLAEEFGNWEDSRRRIDLLALDKSANLVVIELKRTEDGGHMELQAVRYAAMIAGMTFAEATEAHAAYMQRLGRPGDAQAAILKFLDWEEPDEDRFAQDVRIVLVSADFGKELTTAVMWLNDYDLDIRCVRIIPYGDNGRVLVDVQQIIPLPEAEQYQVRIREKAERERAARRTQSGRSALYLQFWTELLAKARQKTELHAGMSPPPQNWVSAGAGVSGYICSWGYVLGSAGPRVELYIDHPSSPDAVKQLYDRLYQERAAIEGRFGGCLIWERLDTKRASRVKFDVPGGNFDDASTWPALQDQMVAAMIRLEQALRPALDKVANR